MHHNAQFQNTKFRLRIPRPGDTMRTVWHKVFGSARHRGVHDAFLGRAARPDYLAERAKLAKWIAENKRLMVDPVYPEAGLQYYVPTVSGGTDCDGYRVGPCYHVCRATVTHYNYIRDQALDWADGPHYYCGSDWESYENRHAHNEAA